MPQTQRPIKPVACNKAVKCERVSMISPPILSPILSRLHAVYAPIEAGRDLSLSFNNIPEAKKTIHFPEKIRISTYVIVRIHSAP